MKKLLWGLVPLVVVAIAVAWTLHAKSGAAAPADAPAPVATVEAAVPVEKTLTRTLEAFGEVTPGKTVGISFQRAGQVALLDVFSGKRVSKGTVLASLSPDPATVQAYDQAVTAMNLAEREWHRLEDLLKLQLATRSQVDAAEKAFLDARGSVKALRATGGGSGDSTVVAPFDGVVVSTAVAQGDRVAPGAPILQLGHVDVLRVQIGIEPSDGPLVHLGTKLRLLPLAGVDDRPAAIDAAVGEIQDVVDPKTLLLSAMVVLRPPQTAGLVPGMKVRATLEVGRATALALPRDAVLTDEKGDYVYQVDAGKAHRVGVSRGIESDGFVAVDGLRDAGRPIVTSGNYVLADGMDVKVAAPVAPRKTR